MDALPGNTRWLSRIGRLSPLTGRQNLIETMHHEYLHSIGVESHISNPTGWGIRVRKDLGGWIMNKPSKTDWKRLSKMKDKDIDTSDIPELDDAFFENAELRLPPKHPVTLWLDADVLA